MTDPEKLEAFRQAAEKNRTNGGNVALRAADFCFLVDLAVAEADRQAAASAAAAEAATREQKQAAAVKRTRKAKGADDEPVAEGEAPASARDTTDDPPIA